MFWLQIIWFVITNFGAILGFIRDIKEMISGIEDARQREAFRAEAKKLIYEAVASKDPRKLNAFMVRLSTYVDDHK